MIHYSIFKQKTAYEIMPSLVGSEMCIRDRSYTTSSNLVSLVSENTAVSLVDMILMEESSRDKHSKTGTVIKLKDCKYTWLRIVYLRG